MPQVHIIGQIRGATGYDSLDVFCKYKFEAGSKWHLLNGEDKGRTWVSERIDETELALWNQPLSITYATSSVLGWPKLYVEVYSCDSSRRVYLVGYGFCFVPSCSGKYQREIATFQPKGSLLDSLKSYFLGGSSQYDKPQEVVLSGASRAGHVTVSTGLVHVDLSIVMAGFGSDSSMTIHAPSPLSVNESVCNKCSASVHRMETNEKLKMEQELALLRAQSMAALYSTSAASSSSSSSSSSANTSSSFFSTSSASSASFSSASFFVSSSSFISTTAANPVSTSFSSSSLSSSASASSSSSSNLSSTSSVTAPPSSSNSLLGTFPSSSGFLPFTGTALTSSSVPVFSNSSSSSNPQSLASTSSAKS
eukprot:TRINITY_DN132_c0_g1_i1.p1 TRINITY_DN132_c0_g1~~TRINITY_DN132_c0_g1_i1.p1  ORF type:complete len:365 (+),score=114.17 TRINITY_DN132_c0_g1_i1:94-1188(+)